MAAEVSAFDDLHWTATRYSQALGIDVRAVNERLATIPNSMRGARKVWHVREGMPALFGSSKKKNPSDMEPKDELDYYKAQREKIKLAQDIGQMCLAAEVESTIGEAFKTLAQTLDGLPDSLERTHGLSPAVISSIYTSIDAARTVLYESLMSAFEVPVRES